MAIDGVNPFYNASYNTTMSYEWRRNNWNVPATGTALEIAASSWLAAGAPGCATALPVTGAGEACSRGTPGALPMPAAVGGQIIYMQHVNIVSVNSTVFKLYDRIWQNSGLDGSTLTEQPINGVALPARAGNYELIMPFAEVYATTGSPVAVNVTFHYINSADADETAVTTGVALGGAGRFIPLNLAAGARGVKRPMGATISGATGGTVNWGITLARFVLANPTAGASWAGEPKSSIDQGGPKVDDNACLFITGLFGAAAASTSAHGGVSLVQG